MSVDVTYFGLDDFAFPALTATGTTVEPRYFGLDDFAWPEVASGTPSRTTGAYPVVVSARPRHSQPVSRPRIQTVVPSPARSRPQPLVTVPVVSPNTVVRVPPPPESVVVP